MSSLTLYLYISSGVVIGLLAAFAAHNRKVGWKKSRTTLAEALDDFYEDLGLGTPVAGMEPQQPFITRKLVQVDPADFSSQLIRLKGALGDSTAVTPQESKVPEGVREDQLVKVQVR